MKKFYITALGIIGVFLFALASPAKGQSLKVGAKGGYNLSTVALDYTKAYDFRSGYSGGIFGEYQFGGMPLSVAVEAHFMEYGANDIEPSLIYYSESPLLTGTPLEKSHLRFRSVEVPLLVKFQLPFLENLSPGIYLGSSYNYIYQADNLNEFSDDLDEFEGDKVGTADIDDRIRNYDVTGIAGLGLEVDMAPLVLTLDARYRMGFRNLNNVAGHDAFTAHSWQFMAGVAYNINLGSGGE